MNIKKIILTSAISAALVVPLSQTSLGNIINYDYTVQASKHKSTNHKKHVKKVKKQSKKHSKKVKKVKKHLAKKKVNKKTTNKKNNSSSSSSSNAASNISQIVTNSATSSSISATSSSSNTTSNTSSASSNASQSSNNSTAITNTSSSSTSQSNISSASSSNSTSSSASQSSSVSSANNNQPSANSNQSSSTNSSDFEPNIVNGKFTDPVIVFKNSNSSKITDDDYLNYTNAVHSELSIFTEFNSNINYVTNNSWFRQRYDMGDFYTTQTYNDFANSFNTIVSDMNTNVDNYDKEGIKYTYSQLTPSDDPDEPVDQITDADRNFVNHDYGRVGNIDQVFGIIRLQETVNDCYQYFGTRFSSTENNRLKTLYNNVNNNKINDNSDVSKIPSQWNNIKAFFAELSNAFSTL
ncbi:hypothetical protein [Lactobacillus sp. Sy-1]|uniref:hypothetical protein n=1 Tax=Lactobacillus sp. Sy-1 TaxID=2109645 RepID=UPI001C5BC433|nr:hypothetical protein [Lactobacillus sp. Sy-1]MBW1606076.1 hypothetical protein [Lactobacillus sp. Sy-1]